MISFLKLSYAKIFWITIFLVKNRYKKKCILLVRNRLATWLRPRFVRFHATSCLVNNKRVLLFVGSHMLLRLERMKRGSSYELLSARPKSNSCYCSENSGACLHCSLNSFFFLKTGEQWRHAS